MIRNANDGDIEWLLGELKEFASEYPFKSFQFPTDAAAYHILMDYMQYGLLMVCERNGERSGFIAGIETPLLGNPSVSVLVERFWWVTKSARRTRAGYELLRSFMNHAKELGIGAVISVASNTNIRDNTMRKLGLHLMESHYLMEI